MTPTNPAVDQYHATVGGAAHLMAALLGTATART